MARKSSKASIRNRPAGIRESALGEPLLRRRFFVFAIVLVATNFIAYSNSFQASWHFDDLPNIVSNRGIHIRDLSWESLHTAWSVTTGGRRPVSYLSFALNYLISGSEVFSYHVVNFSIHALNAVFVFLLLWLFARKSLTASTPQQQQILAFLAAGLWSLHPIQTQSVTYIVQRMSSLSTLFLLAAFVFYIQLRSARRVGVRIACLTAFLLCALLACLSKENAYILPLALVVYEFFFAIPWEFLKAHAWKLLVACLILAILSVAVLYGSGVIRELNRQYSGRSFTMKERLLTEARIVFFYFSMLVAPFWDRQALHHEIEKSTSLFHPWTTFPSILLIVSAIGFSIGLKNRKPLYGFLGLWFFVFLVIESSFWPLELAFEHRLYLPSIGVIALLVFAGSEQFRCFANRSRGVLFAAFMLGICVGLMWLTFNRNKVWEDDFTLWQDNLTKYPQSHRVQNNFGVACGERGDSQLAEIAFLEALRLKPDFDEARSNLALLCLNSGRDGEALKWAEEVHQRNLSPFAEFNLGIVYSKLGDYPKSILCYQKALARNRSYAQAYFNLGLVCLKAHEYDLAKSSFEGFLESWSGPAESSYVQEAKNHLEELAGSR